MLPRPRKKYWFTVVSYLADGGGTPLYLCNNIDSLVRIDAYRILNELESKEWVESGVVKHDGGKSSYYELTDEGYDELVTIYTDLRLQDG